MCVSADRSARTKIKWDRLRAVSFVSPIIRKLFRLFSCDRVKYFFFTNSLKHSANSNGIRPS